jgi:hypothetical protein
VACHRADPGHQSRAIEVNIGAALSRYQVRRYQEAFSNTAWNASTKA